MNARFIVAPTILSKNLRKNLENTRYRLALFNCHRENQMKHKKRKQSKTSKRFYRLPLLVVICAVAFLAVGAITVISRQKASAKQPTTVEPTVAAANKAPGNFVTVKVAGHDVQVDPQTGQIKPLSPQEAQQLAEGLKGMLNKSTEGLEPVREADGSIDLNLQGRFRNVAVARVNSDGTLEQSCVDTPEAGAKFFGIDPQLVGAERTPQATRPSQKKALQ